MYDPSAGRWLTQDPIGFEAGDANLYRYVGNNSTNLTDPTGLAGEGPLGKGKDPPVKGGDDMPWELDDKIAALDRNFMGVADTGLFVDLIRGGIKIGKQDGYDLWAHFLEHFIAPMGGERESAPYRVPAQFIPAVSRHSERMIKHLLLKAVAEGGKIPAKPGPFIIPEQKVRWRSSNLALNLGELLTQDEKTQLVDEYMFRAYGGALVTIKGDVLRYDPVRPGAPRLMNGVYTVRATVTIRDHFTFGPAGPLGARNWLGGELGNIYMGGSGLQLRVASATKRRLNFWNTITFKATYRFTD